MSSDLTIKSLGLVTSVGYDVEHSCASFRAGVSKAQEHVDYPIFSAELEYIPVTAHRAELLTDGFVQTGLWLRLLQQALKDVQSYGNLPTPEEDSNFWKRSACCLNLPFIAFDRFGWPFKEIENLSEYFVYRFIKEDYPFVKLPMKTVLSYGPTGLAQTLQKCPKILSSPAIDRIFLVSVDSYNDPGSLSYLEENHRLFTPKNHLGVMPGEAAGVLMLETSTGGSPTNSHSTIIASSHSEGPGEHPDEDLTPFIQDLGRRFTGVIENVLKEAQVELPFKGDLIFDLSGESWRAQVVGWAQMELTDRDLVDFEASSIHIPATSFGEIGAVSATASVCVADHFFKRLASPHRQALILSLSYEGDASALMVQRAGE